MILKFIKPSIKTLSKLQCSFSNPQKKRTQAPKYTRTKQKIDPKNIDYNVVPQDLRKGVKAYVEATNMLVTSQAQLEAITLKQVILQERTKFQQTLDKIDQPQTKATQKKQGQTPEQKNYDLMNALKFISNVSNGVMVMNITGYFLFHMAKKYQMLGFFLGASINPSMIALTGLSVGFNAAAWIIIQSLHLSIKDPKELTLDKVSLKGCSTLMGLQALMICIQTAGLGYYLMQPNPFENMIFLIGSYGLSQAHIFYNIIKATGGYRFEYFSKILITQIMSSLFVGFLAYNLFNKINKVENIAEYGSILNSSELQSFDENIQLKSGYEKFLSQFKAKQISVVKGQAINKLILDESK